MSRGSKERRNLLDKGYILHRKNKCEDCGTGGVERDSGGFMIRKIGGGLTVHHIDGNPANNDISNLQTLCRKCHNKKHNIK